ncbi:MAG: ATP-dependent helicase [Fibrobacterota bacterium]
MTESDKILEGLNTEQKTAVIHNHGKNGPLLILAGAGSGKTAVTVRRIAYLISKGISPSSILALTFTRKAAEELKDRTGEFINRIPGNPDSRVTAGTFHSVCLSILRENKKVRVASGRELNSILKKAMDFLPEYPGIPDIRSAQRAIDLIRNGKSDILNDECLDYAHKLNSVYYGFKLKCNAYDFSDIIEETVRMFLENENILEDCRKRFRYLLIDEYQDTNDIQYRFSRLLAGKSPNVFAVGDDDQSIYSFRGADIKNILNFRKDYPDAEIIKLETNYRSSGNILAAANSVFKNKPKELRKALRVNHVTKEPLFLENRKVRIKFFKNCNDEHAFILSEIEKIHRQDGLPPGSFAVLYRNNSTGEIFRERTRSSLAEPQLKKLYETIILSTLHASKGLQYPVVFFTGLEEGICPFGAANIEEERRLFYVGITRARFILYLSSCRYRTIRNAPVKFKTSRFISALPAEAVKKDGILNTLKEKLIFRE